MNSIEYGREAINAEIKRQIKEVKAGGTIESWTLDWDEETQTLSKMRSKETEADYRYFKEPDLLPIILDEKRKKELLEDLPELPIARKSRFIEDFKLSDYDSNILTSDLDLSEFFIEAVEMYDSDAHDTANFLINDVQGMMNELDLSISELYLNAEHLSKILLLIDKGEINTSTGKSLVRKTQDLKMNPQEIVEKEGLAQVTDSGAIESICQEVIQENPSQVEQYQSGKEGVMGWLIGQVMAKSGGKADPQVVKETLKSLLS
jgi:aspartyl-tRNA(Asn)/glutamyl-tRNA(Gln) amidotransferase subunit B